MDHTLTTGKEFRIGWLLFLLRSSASSGYGYDLRRELGLRGVAMDPAILYRSLREMESRGLIASHWVHSEEGPRRRVYSITARGEAELEGLAQAIKQARDAHDAFLSAYRELGGARRRRRGSA